MMLTIGQLLTLAIFATTIGLIVLRVIPEALAGLIGASLMVILGLAPFRKAVSVFIDWNIILILLGMWMITYYMVEAGLPKLLILYSSKYAKTYEDLVIILSFIAGVISMFVDNVLVVLLLSPIVIEVSREVKQNPVYGVLLVSLSANFMGTALLLGDLPPQLLHSVVGFEFLDFIVYQGKPSSFPILTLSFIITLYLYRKLLLKSKTPIKAFTNTNENINVNFKLVKISTFLFILTIMVMSLRREISMRLSVFLSPITTTYDLKLGLISMSGAVFLTLAIEILRIKRKIRAPGFEEAVKNIQWDAILFYATLFILAETLEYRGILSMFAKSLEPMFVSGTLLSSSIVYWASAPVVAFIEHDAFILTMLLTLKELVKSGVLLNSAPLYWALLWAGTLGSNFTVVGAPALYVALSILRSKGFIVKLKTFYSITIPYALISLITTFLIALPIWFI